MRADFILMLGLLVGCAGLAHAEPPEGSSGPATCVSAADLRAVLAAARNTRMVDLNVRKVSADGADIFVNIARRTSEKTPTSSALAHRNVTEVYYVIEGAGILVTGGTLRDPEESASGANVTGKGIEGGESRRIQAGDVVVIPAGTPHAFSSVEKTIVYLNLRIDPTVR